MVGDGFAATLVAQGHFQIFFNREHTPMLQSRLSLGMKLMYCSGVWSYVVGAIATPTFIIIPLVQPPPRCAAQPVQPMGVREGGKDPGMHTGRFSGIPVRQLRGSEGGWGMCTDHARCSQHP